MAVSKRSLRLATIGAVAAGTLALGVGSAFAVGDIGPGSTDVAGVKCVQRAMNFFETPTLTVDGSYGPLTTSAVEKFQSEFGDSVDGVVGPQTAGTIRTEINHLITVIHHTGGNPAPEDAWVSQCSSLLP